MNNEIKEILEDLKNEDISVDDLTHNDKVKLLDCITNLEQENNYYFKKNNELSALNTSLRIDRDNYKSRIDKAIEILSSWKQEYNGLMKTNNIYIPIDKPSKFDLLNILQGSDK